MVLINIIPQMSLSSSDEHLVKSPREFEPSTDKNQTTVRYEKLSGRYEKEGLLASRELKTTTDNIR